MLTLKRKKKGNCQQQLPKRQVEIKKFTKKTTAKAQPDYLSPSEGPNIQPTKKNESRTCVWDARRKKE